MLNVRTVVIHDTIPIVERHLKDSAACGMGDAIDQDIQAPVPLAHMFEHSGDLAGIGDVSRKAIAA